MKKISVLSVAVLLAFPAVAVENVHKLYGAEPEPENTMAQYENKLKTAETKKVKSTEALKETGKVDETKKAAEAEKPQKADPVKKVKEVKEVEEVKTVKKVRKAEKKPVAKDEQKVDEIKQESTKQDVPLNPKARFPHGLQLGVGISPTSGLNGFIGYNNKNFNSFWAKRFGVRFDFASYSPIKRKINKEINRIADDKGGIKFDDSLKIDNIAVDAKHYGAMIDFYPFGDTWFLGGLRVSGGYFVGKFDLNADVYGTPSDGKIEFELNDNKYYYVGDEMRARITADWKYRGPYLGTGFDLGLFLGFKIYFDAGVVFTGNTAKFDLDAPIDALENANHVAIVEDSAEYAQFIQDKNKEIEDARKEIKDYPYYPLVKLGFMYRF